mgnify:CR=1 FL=1
MNILDKINKPNDIKDIDREDLPELADEIREFLVSHVSETGGHLAPNLGCVELTMALHRVLDFPEDKLIWDVGHQSYVHKIPQETRGCPGIAPECPVPVRHGDRHCCLFYIKVLFRSGSTQLHPLILLT